MRDINGNFIHYLSLKEWLQKEEALVGGIWLIMSYVRKSFASVADDEYLNRAFSELDDCVEWVRETGRPKKEASSSFSVKYCPGHWNWISLWWSLFKECVYLCLWAGQPNWCERDIYEEINYYKSYLNVDQN